MLRPQAPLTSGNRRLRDVLTYSHLANSKRQRENVGSPSLQPRVNFNSIGRGLAYG